MVYSKSKKILFVLLCIFIILFPFALITTTFATEGSTDDEQITFDVVNNLQITADSNVFLYNSNSGFSVGYIPIDNNYIYTISGFDSSMPIAESNDIPSTNVSYNYLTTVSSNGSYTYRGNGYLYLCFRSNATGIRPTVTRRPVESMNTTIAGLVDNVGIISFWNIFDISINYIVIVVLVAFGIFIITRILKKISKGKEGL